MKQSAAPIEVAPIRTPPSPSFIPEEIRSERLLLRKPKAGDEVLVNETIQDSFESLRKWMPWAQERPSVLETEENRRGAIEKWNDRSVLRLLGFELTTGKLVLSAGFHDIDWSVPSLSVGYWVRSQFEGKGFVTEAVRAHAVFAFDALEVRRIELTADERNNASRQVAVSAGFKLEGILRNECRDTQGDLRNTALYSMTSRDEILKRGKVSWQ